MEAGSLTAISHTRFLMDAHARNPGMTERSVGAARTADGLTSYEALCRFADPQPGMTVVDLACGNGPLCEILAERVGPQGQVVGVDLSDAEITLARERLSRFPNVRLLNASADGLPLADASADLVLCHMAFMLFSPLAQAVQEIGRVLKPGGMFAAVVPTLRKPTELFCACAASLRAALQAEGHALEALSGSAVSMSSLADLAGIFAGGIWCTAGIATCAVEVSVSAPPSALVARVSPAFYNYQRLTEGGKRQIDESWQRLFEQDGRATGSATFHFPLSAFSVQREAAGGWSHAKR